MHLARMDVSTLYHQYEIVELGSCVRKFVVPAQVLMQDGECEVELLSDEQWDEEMTHAHETAWNMYPPGEPLRTLSRSRHN